MIRKLILALSALIMIFGCNGNSGDKISTPVLIVEKPDAKYILEHKSTGDSRTEGFNLSGVNRVIFETEADDSPNGTVSLYLVNKDTKEEILFAQIDDNVVPGTGESYIDGNGSYYIKVDHSYSPVSAITLKMEETQPTENIWHVSIGNSRTQTFNLDGVKKVIFDTYESNFPNGTVSLYLVNKDTEEKILFAQIDDNVVPGTGESYIEGNGSYYIKVDHSYTPVSAVTIKTEDAQQTDNT